MPAIFIVNMAGVTVAHNASMIKIYLTPVQIGGMTLVTFGPGNNMPPRYIVSMAAGTWQVRCIVIKHRRQPITIVMAKVTLRIGCYVSRIFVLTVAAGAGSLHFIVINPDNW